jgi:hypothetical protein
MASHKGPFIGVQEAILLRIRREDDVEGAQHMNTSTGSLLMKR